MQSQNPVPFRLSLALGLFALGWFILAAPWLLGQVTIPWDAKAHWYPHLVFAARSLHVAASPAWTPNIFAGSPEIADPQSVLFSAPLLALAVLTAKPSLTAMDWAVFAMLFAGGTGVLLLFRDRGWHWGGGLVAALAFAFGAAASWRIQHLSQVFSLCWWPIAWWCLARALDRHSVLYGIAAGLAAALMVLGRDQVALLCAYLLAATVLAHWVAAERPWVKVGATLGPLTAATLAGALVVAVPVLMSALWGAESNRIVIDEIGAGRGSLHPAHLLTWIVGNLYGAAGPLAEHWGPPSPTWGETGLFLARNMGNLYAGALPLILVLGLLRSGALLDRDIRFVTVALVVTLLYALGWYTPAFSLFWHLPGVDLFRRPADAAFVIGGLFAILAGYGAHRLLTGTLRTGWRVEALVAAALVTLASALIVSKGAPPAAWTNLAIAAGTIALSLLVLGLGRRLTAAGLAILLAAVLVADLRLTNGPSESTALPPASYAVLEPGSTDPALALIRSLTVRDATRRDRVELIGLGYEWQNAAMSHDFEDVLGFNPVRSAAFANLVGAEDIAALPGQRRFPPAFPSYRSELADILGLRFVVTRVPPGDIDRRLPADALPLVAEAGGVRIHENTRALPRVWVAPTAMETPPDLAVAGFPSGLDPRRTVLVEGPVPPVRQAGGTARILAYGNTGVTVETTTADGGILVLADAWHPWWSARIDGRDVPVHRAFGVVRAVEVPGGTATVTFTFEPLRGLLRQIQAGSRRS
ncbi:MAG: hypothetical protein Q8O26_04480 [Phreatobacter sp.]|uniref:hypothetical protein n=1 Tax=Phreatobacter sp. TaxID=1966341 RepID=UPI0027325284|nr:hypothetical protein [Phreatobacter sp.]MDP2801121.1 hypothetical protein [Phreatobacter sp.]